MAHAYGIDQLGFTGKDGKPILLGTGQTIAIVDAYADPNIATELATFDSPFSISNTDGNGVLAVTTFMMARKIPTNSGWALETALDVEWAHAIAPGAHILLVEAKSSSMADLIAAVDYAKAQPNVVAVSMSWGGKEFSGETAYDSHFQQMGVTFLSASGDYGAPAEYPSTSPGVIAVGGTSLTLGLPSGQYVSETAWNDSGGGISLYESKPSYQGSVTLGGASRTNPDVAYDADPATGVAVYSLANGRGKWYQVGGTSIGAPQWAALVATADQARVLAGKAPLNGAQDVLTALYGLPGDFHDIISGSNGYSAGPGYDLVTGLGSPKANLVVQDLAAFSATSTVMAPAGVLGAISPVTGMAVASSLPMGPVSAAAPGVQADFATPFAQSGSAPDLMPWGEPMQPAPVPAETSGTAFRIEDFSASDPPAAAAPSSLPRVALDVLVAGDVLAGSVLEIV
jgi:subtilase family serine protease